MDNEKTMAERPATRVESLLRNIGQNNNSIREELLMLQGRLQRFDNVANRVHPEGYWRNISIKEELTKNNIGMAEQEPVSGHLLNLTNIVVDQKNLLRLVSEIIGDIDNTAAFFETNI